MTEAMSGTGTARGAETGTDETSRNRDSKRNTVTRLGTNKKG
jgi:hypothetical protein